jgi:hypothetical protein
VRSRIESHVLPGRHAASSALVVPNALTTDFRRHAFACVADGLLLRGGPWQASPRAAHHGESYDE